jgi:thioredoxin 1
VLDNPAPVLLAFVKYPDSTSQALRPVLAEVAQKRDDSLRVATVDVPANPATTGHWGVTQIPTMVLLDRGVVQRVLLGVRPAARLLEEIDEALGRRRHGEL